MGQTRQQDTARESILLAYDLPEIGPESDPRQKDESTVIEIVEEMEKGLLPAQNQDEQGEQCKFSIPYYL